jgi:trk system potassium uptake protein TrkH
MRYTAVQRIVGLLIAIASLMMLPPAVVSWWYQDGTASLFLLSAAILLVIGHLLYLPVRHAHQDLRVRDGFLVVAACWIAVALVGALPFWLLTAPQMSYVDALFESMSGLTTTGATILTSIDTMPHGILFYRQQLQWLGGMGIIVMAVAILPMLRIGGMQLYRAETPGPLKDSKLTPRVAETAKALWLIYFGITVTCALAYWLAGMSLFDAVGHAFSTVSTGGFSSYNANLGYFNSATIEAIAVVFMVISAMNFALHFSAWRKASAQPYFQDPELKVFAGLLISLGALAGFTMFINGTYASLPESIRYAGFQVISAMTTAGFTTTDFHLWAGFLPIMVMCIAFIGGCSGSTVGGMKVIRVILLYRQAAREIRRLIHPNSVIAVKIGGQKTPGTVLNAVWGFFFLYTATFALLTVLLSATGLDFVTAFGAVTACITNFGPGLGEAGPHYANLSGAAKLILSFAMLAGRLEFYPLLVLLTPTFWRD